MINSQQTQQGNNSLKQEAIRDIQRSNGNKAGRVKPSLSFGESIKICFTKYCNFKGRARRSEYWWFYLLFFICSIFPPVGIAFILPHLGVATRRLHDVGQSGTLYGLYLTFSLYLNIFWFMALKSIMAGKNDFWSLCLLIGLSVVVCAFGVYIIILWCRDSQPKENDWGLSPKYQ